MSERRRIGNALYVTAAGTYQTWWRDELDVQHWETVNTIEAAIRLRDRHRAERETFVRTFERTQLGRLAKALTPPHISEAEELERLLHQEPPDTDIPVYTIRN